MTAGSLLGQAVGTVGGATLGPPPPPVTAWKPPALPAAPVLPAGPIGSLMTFDQWLGANGTWLQQQGQSNAARSSLQANYGWVRDAAGNLHPDTNAAPDSILGGLDRQVSVRKNQSAQQAANRGSLFSGGTINEVDKATEAYNQGVAKAQGSLIDKLGAVDQNDIQTKISLDPQYEDDVGQTKITSPTDALTAFKAMKPGVGVAGIDAYLKKYGEFLTPAERAAFKTQRDAMFKQFTAPPVVAPPAQTKTVVVDTKPTRLRHRKHRKHRPPPPKLHTGGIAGGHAR
jgi:hypothetical protein